MPRALLSVALSVLLAALLFVSRGQAAVPLAVRVSSFQMVAPGRVRFDVAIAGLQPGLRPTMEGTAILGGRSVGGSSFPVVASRIPAVIDLPAGRALIGGISVGDFPPVPPLRENLQISVTLAVRQGNEVATARQTGELLLPTVIVPGYLNDFRGGGPERAVVSAFERRGYRATGAWPSLFWFTYNSRGLTLEGASRALAAYVRDEALPAAYAARINVVGYSLGGLVARWNLAFEPGWDHLVNRFVMVGVPNEGAVMSYVYAWYPVASWARTPAARGLLPTFPFWRRTANDRWRIPADARNPELYRLNTHPLPAGIQAYAFYGNQRPAADGPGTEAGITGRLPGARFSYGPGDGIVLAASALGLPINGGPGVSGLADRLVMKVDLGAVGHRSLLEAAASKVAGALLDQGTAARDGAPGDGAEEAPGLQDATNGAGSPGAGGGFLDAH